MFSENKTELPLKKLRIDIRTRKTLLGNTLNNCGYYLCISLWLIFYCFFSFFKNSYISIYQDNKKVICSFLKDKL